MKKLQENKKKFTLWIVGVVIICLILVELFQNFSSVSSMVAKVFKLFSPLVTGLIFALILNVPMRFFESHLWLKSNNKILIKLRSPIAFIISLILIFGIVSGIVWLIIPELYHSIKIIIQGCADIITKLQESEKIEIGGIPVSDYIEKLNWDDLVTKAEDWLKNQSGNIFNNVLGFVTSFIGGIFDFLISFVFAIYIIFNKSVLKRQAKRLLRAWFPKTFSTWFIHSCAVAGTNFRNYISGQTIEALILGSLCVLGMLILRIPYAPMVGILVGITAFIPVVGAFIGAGVGAFMILTTAPFKAVVFIIFIIILQQLENNLIYPKVMGSHVNLPGMWILAAVTVGGGIGGVLGMLLSVPVASTAYTLIKEATLIKESKNKKKNPENEENDDEIFGIVSSDEQNEKEDKTLQAEDENKADADKKDTE